MKKKVSVIIPCYNREQYIAETIESVLCQTYKTTELIVVDDGCTDNSREIIESFTSKIKILEHPGGVNKGQSAAINLGLKNATGTYIAILDSDDLFSSEKIVRQVSFLETHPEAGLVYANGTVIDAEGKRRYTIYQPGDRPLIGPEPVLEYCAFNLPSNALVRKTVFDKAGFFDESFRTAQDHDMAIRLAEIAPVGYIDECLWSYRRHNASISHTRTLERWHNGFQILQAASKRYPYPLRTRLRRKAVLHFRLGQCYLQQKKILTAATHFFMAGICNPLRSLRVISAQENITSPQS